MVVGGIKSTVIAACRSDSEIDSEGSLDSEAALETNYSLAAELEGPKN